MEKSGTAAGTICPRLLKIFFVIAELCAGSLIFAQSFDNLKFTASSEYFFTTSDGTYELVLPSCKPDQVQLEVNDFIKNVSFVSLKKEAVLPDDTRIVLRVNFSVPGEYKLNPIYIRIRGRRYKVFFDTVNVYENPRSVQPQVEAVIKEIDGVPFEYGKTIKIHAGQKVLFTVNIRYAVQVLQLSWPLPENSLFQETERYEITEAVPRGTSFSPDTVPVASYLWQPFIPGDYELPYVFVTATSYGGVRSETTFAPVKITVQNAITQKKDDYQDSSAFSYAFAEVDSEEDMHGAQELSIAQLGSLVMLNSRERHSLPFLSAAYKERVEAESKIGLVPSERLPSVPFAVILFFITVLFLSGSVFLFIVHKRKGAVACAVFALVFFALTAVYSSRVKDVNAVYAGGYLSTVPEENVYSGISLRPGSRVLVERMADEWVYIQYNDINGWVKASSVYFIK